MDKRLTKRKIKQEFRDILGQYGFFHLTDYQIVKVTPGNILQIICFELADLGMTCSVAMQPLYIFDGTPGVISLNMGARLSRFKTFLPEWWDSGDIDGDLKQIKQLLLDNGMPWFEKYGSPEGIVEFIQKGKSREYDFGQFRSYGETEYLAFSLLYLGRLKEGLDCLDEFVNRPILPHAADFWKRYIRDLFALVNNMKQNQTNIPDILEKLVTENKKTLKIKPT
jgi:hypothetical protein